MDVTGQLGSFTVALRAGTVTIKRPCSNFCPIDAETISLTMVEAREIDKPEKGEPLLWRLLTTINAETLEEASDVVRLYRLRWRIEEIFRALKKTGIDLEDTRLHAANRLFKLATIGLIAVTRTLQLVDARNGGPRPASDLLDPAYLAAAEAIGRSFDGRIDRQKNPYPLHSLAWLSWIVARLGGWNCFYKSPGSKTMNSGWERFSARVAGFILAKQNV